MSKIEISIRMIQHYLYCPHRWGLLEIDKAWAENVFVTKGNLMHERVHNPKKHYTAKGKKIFTSVPVYHDLDPYYLYGITDCLELTEDESGVFVDGSKEKYAISIVEYKPTKPKNGVYREEDLMQLFAQKVCVDYVFGCDCEAFIYYGDVKRRFLLPLRENYEMYNSNLQQILKEMRKKTVLGLIPPISKNQNCNGCSMKDLCMPSVHTVIPLQAEIEKLLEKECYEGN